MRVYYCDHYEVALPAGHRFPMGKYGAIRERLVQDGILDACDLLPSRLASTAELRLAHTEHYVDAVVGGTLSEKSIRKLGLPWSSALVLRSRASVGGSLSAAEAALSDGIAGNLAGGTHHARADEGSGYCVFNDLAVVTAALMSAGRAKRVAVVDLDVHQGDGTASILGGRKDVFLLSMHGAKNFPFEKVPGTLDIALPDGTGDVEYLDCLDEALDAVFAFQPELVLYQAGVDPLAEDRIGRLALSLDGLAERDRRVLTRAREHGVPIALSLGGGYAEPIEHTVAATVQTYRVAKEVFAVP